MLNEHDINVKMREKCLPPAVIKYAELDGEGEGDGGQGVVIGITVGALVVALSSCCLINYYMNKKARAKEVLPDTIPQVASPAVGC